MALSYTFSIMMSEESIRTMCRLPRKPDVRIRACRLLLLAVLAPALHAQQVLTWAQIRDQFKRTNPTLLADQVNIDEARAQEITAYLRPNPSITFALDQFTVFPTPNTPYRPVAGVLEAGSINYLHERQHKRELRLESAQENTSITSSQHQDLERSLLFNLRTAFVNALEAKEFFNIAKQNLAYWDKEIDINRERFKAGDIAKVDFDRILLQRAQYQSDYVNSQVNLRTAKIALLMLLNDRTPVERFDITGPYEFSENLLPLEQFRQMAMDTRPDLKAAVETVVQSRTNHQLAIANGTADPTFGFDIGRNPPLPSYIGFSVSFDLRIFDKNQGEKLRTKLDIDRASKARTAAEAQVLSDVDSAYATLGSTVELLRPYKEEYLPKAVEVRDIETYAYQRGGASLLDFLDAQAAYRQTQLAYVNLIQSYLAAAAQLNLAVGREVVE
jgi:cobalt-zinc-cadmium efflux system outer membrane protein